MIVGVALVAASAMVVATFVCVALAMTSARVDARRRRAAVALRAAERTQDSAQHEHPRLDAPTRPLHVLTSQLRHEVDPVTRMDLAMGMAALGGTQPALALVAAVRDGVISPTAGAHAVWRTGFHGGVVAGAAVHDPDPRVRTFARMVLDGAMHS